MGTLGARACTGRMSVRMGGIGRMGALGWNLDLVMFARWSAPRAARTRAPTSTLCCPLLASPGRLVKSFFSTAKW